ncbi:MAG: DUF6798 domain-containing protein [Rhodothermales bacterium]
MLRFGYGYGASDQDEFIPLLLHKLDPTLFRQDWFVQTQLDAFSVRTYFSWLLHALSLVMPVPLAVFAVYAASWIGIACGIYRLALALTGVPLAAALSIALVLLATPFWTLGGNDLAHSMLVPSMTSWAIGLIGLGWFVEGRHARAAGWMGVATWMQALVGLQLALLGGLILLSLARRPGGVRRTGVFGMAYLLAAAPALGPLFYQQFTGDAATGVDLFYIMARFRNPHHYLFHSFSERSFVRFGLLASAGLAGWIVLRRTLDPDRWHLIVRALVIMLIVCGLAYVATEQLNALTVAKLQLFKLTVVAKLLFCVGIAGAGVHLLPAQVRQYILRTLERLTWQSGLLGAVLVAVGCIYMIGRDDLTHKIYPFSLRTSPSAAMETWARRETPVDAVFAVPPSLSSFRSGAQRAIVIDHKAFPYRDTDIGEWFTRLIDMAPIALPERTDATLMRRLDEAYEGLSAQELAERIDRYGIAYIVRETPLPDAAGARLVHVSPPWHVYQFASTAP